MPLSPELRAKYDRLRALLAAQDSLAVAFSSGVDSTLLLDTAQKVLGEHVLALTAVSRSFPKRERDEASDFCRSRGIRQILVESEELDIEGFRDNPPDRCYLCKRELFTKLLDTARAEGFSAVAEGSNLDDLSDYRPGLRAIEELGILSPLREAGLTKSEIRALSREAQLPTHAKPSFACLASRFVYGEPITEEKLAMVEQAEQRLLDLGFTQFRVRIHGKMARIELAPGEISRFMNEETRKEVSSYLHELGFLYVSLDLDGYRTGSMNRMIGK